MYADPQTLNAQTLPRTTSAQDRGEFRLADKTHSLKVSHTYAKRSRHLARYDHSKIAADPFTAGQSVRYSASVYLVVDAPNDGYTAAELKALADAFVAWASASTGANLTKLIAGES
jgi:hypothetical protein